jgi:hypothetical protein
VTREQDQLDHEMGTPPPSTVDLDEIIVRQRRLVRLRQLGVAGSAVAVAVVFTLVLAMLPRAGDARGTVQAGATHQPSPTASAPAPLTPRQREAVRLSTVLKRLMTEALPPAQFLPIPAGQFSVIHPTDTVEPSNALVFLDAGSYFIAGAQIKDSAGTGTIIVSVGKEDTLFRQQRSCGTDPTPLDIRFSCKVVPDPAGAIIRLASTASKYTKYQAFLADMLRADGNGVFITITNSTTTGTDLDTYRPSPPLSLSQTRALAEAPDLATTLS